MKANALKCVIKRVKTNKIKYNFKSFILESLKFILIPNVLQEVFVIPNILQEVFVNLWVGLLESDSVLFDSRCEITIFKKTSLKK